MNIIFCKGILIDRLHVCFNKAIGLIETRQIFCSMKKFYLQKIQTSVSCYVWITLLAKPVYRYHLCGCHKQKVIKTV